MGAPIYNDSDSDFELAERVRTNQQRLTAAFQPQYDFIVCGAGSSGSVIARRLAENPDAQVLLLEAGGSDDVPAVWTADLWPTNLGSERDWGFQSEPNAALNGRPFALPMGKVLGGGSSVNVMVWQRGHRSDWDHFASESGDPAWKYANILNIYRHIEDWRGEPDPDYRGSGGPVFVQPAPDPHPLAFATLEAARSFGIPTFENANGRIMEAGAGASIADLRVRSDRTRVSVFRSYTYPYMDRPNLTVLTHALVWRLIFDTKRVTGVEVLYQGQIHRLKASSEVVLSLGAIHTPKVLMQSGIGDEEELRRFGIPVVQHLPGVGGNYHDHIGFNCVWEFCEPPTPSYLAESMVFWRSRPQLESPDLFLGEGPAPNASPENAKRFGLPEAGWTFFGGLSRPRSRGRVLLTGPDLADRVRIDTNALSHPDDLKTAKECVKFMREIASASALQPHIKREVMPGDLTGADLDDYIRDAASTYWHQVGTAKMGNDSTSVVDGRLKVYGVENLRIADGSIMPRITTANTMAPCVLIGERAAELLIKEHRPSSHGERSECAHSDLQR
jgi:choline dehydrogenase